MKSILFVLTLITSLSTFAGTIKPGTDLLSYTCKSNGSNYSLKIKSTASAKDGENVEVPSTLTIKRIVPVGAEVIILPKVYVGKFLYADVEHIFTTDDNATTLRLYADELEQTTLITTVNGKEIVTRFDCNY